MKWLMILCAGKGKISTLVEVYGIKRMHLRNDISCFLPASCLPNLDGDAFALRAGGAGY
jgi:hypothetical protein